MSDHDIISVGLGKMPYSILGSTRKAMGTHVQYIPQIKRALNGEIVISQHDAKNILDVLTKEQQKYVAFNKEPCKSLAKLIGAWIPCALYKHK